MGGFNLGKALGVNKLISGGVGKLIGGSLGGPIGGLIGDKVVGQLFGGKNKPSNLIKGAFDAPQNPNFGLLQNSALQQQKHGTDTAMKYMGLLDGAVANRASAINAGYGNTELDRMALGQAQTGADAAFRRGSADLALNFARRGLGGGLLAGGHVNLAGQRAATMAGAYNDVARERIARNIAGQQELMQLYGQQQNLGNLLRQQAESQLLNLGTGEAQRKAQGQELAGQFIGELGGQLGKIGNLGNLFRRKTGGNTTTGGNGNTNVNAADAASAP